MFTGGHLPPLTIFPDDEFFNAADSPRMWLRLVRSRSPSIFKFRHLMLVRRYLEGSSLYVSGIGFIARIDVESGQYIWKHDGLYNRRDQAFNSFDAPVITPSEVLFRESDFRNNSRPLKVIRAQKTNGKFSVETW